MLENYIRLIRSAVNSSTILQKSSEWVCNKSFQSNNFSITVDGTTDSSVSDAEIFYIRYTSTLLKFFYWLIYIGRL